MAVYFLAMPVAENPLVRVQMNPSYGALDLPDQANNDFQQVWPIISTPDVQGGLMRLRADSTLNHFTGACGQSIYRGNTFRRIWWVIILFGTGGKDYPPCKSD